jgi:hypothetical protein
MTKTTMIIDGEVVSGFTANVERVRQLIEGHRVQD